MGLAWKVLKVGGFKGMAAKAAFVFLASAVHRAMKDAHAPNAVDSRKRTPARDDRFQAASERAAKWIRDNDVPQQVREFVKEVIGDSRRPQ
jgi:hypothetical protein